MHAILASLHINTKWTCRKIPIMSAGAYIFQRPFLRGLFWGGGAYIQRGLSTEGNLGFKIDWASVIFGSKFTILALFYFVFEGIFPSISPPGAYIWRGDLTQGFFALLVWGAYISKGLYMEGLIFGILWYIKNPFSSISKHFHNRHCLVLKDLRENKNKILSYC